MILSSSGAVLVLRHYSMPRPITCSLISGNLRNFFTIRIKGPVGTYVEIAKGDPVVFGTLDNDVSDICGGFILSKMDRDITITPDIKSFPVERRKSQRYPVSLQGYINHVNDKKCSVPVWIKDISYEGLRIHTETSYNVGDRIGIDICTSIGVPGIEGNIVRSSVLFGRNEYGIELSFRYRSSISTIRGSIDFLIREEKKMIEDQLMALKQ
jgi:hypothetical protein